MASFKTSKVSELLEYIHQRNITNKRMMQEGRPHIGIFWIHKDKPVGVFAEPKDNAEDFGEFKSSKYDHYGSWDQLQRHGMVPDEYKGKEYDEVPRGRITYHQPTKTYHIFLPRNQANNKNLHNSIKSEFKLGGQNVKIRGDQHYEDPSEIQW